MPLLILLLLIGVPLLELAVLIKVGSQIGVLPTIGLLVAIGLLGAYLIRRQGLSAMRKTEQALRQGRVPLEATLDGLALLLAGALMLTPGFLTDILAIGLLIPPIRRWLARAILLRFARRADIDVKVFRHSSRQASHHSDSPPRGGMIIEGEYRRIDESGSDPERG